MTCIVGLVHGGTVYLGCDSQVTTGWTGYTLAGDAPKLFRIDNALIGGTGDHRMLQIVQFGLRIGEHSEGMSNLEFIVTVVAEAIRELLKQRAYTVIENSREKSEGTFLLGYRGDLFVVDALYAVRQTIDGFAAVGSGAEFALGALVALTNNGRAFYPKVALREALEVAARFDIGTSEPFHIMTLEGSAT